MGGKFGTLEERFQRHYIQGDPNECWEWQAGRDKDGYGSIGNGTGRSIKAHRYAYERTYGAILPSMVVMHTCDNPPCVNPNHLRMGTHRENSQDKIRKGRADSSKGASHHSAVLDREKVLQIRQLSTSGGYSQQELAAMFGVKQNTISRTISRKTWKGI
jgi:hypothetical protein